MLFPPIPPRARTTSTGGRSGVQAGLRVAVLVLALAAAAIAVAVQFARYANGTGEDGVAIAQCKADYQRAHTRQDTFIVDNRVPITSRAQATTAVSCGVHRAAHQIR